MSRVFIFDVDGTLTPSRQPMTKEFQKFFGEWIKDNKFYLVTGSDLPKLQEQMCLYDIDAEAIFTCCGNEMWKPDPHIVNISAYQVYEKKFKPPNTLLTFLGDKLRMSDYPVKAGNHIEDRGSMVNFSIVGRDCTQEQREEYFEWDIKEGERREISRAIGFRWPELDAVIGGQISIDIYPKGRDKSQILEKIYEEINSDSHTKTYADTFEYIFIGDGIDNNGNDFPLAELMNTIKNCTAYQTSGWEETKQILEKLND